MLIERFRRRPVIVLSPHFKDACFSLGIFLQTLGRGRLVNIFTRGGEVLEPRMAHAGLREDTIAVIRDLEDRRFAMCCGLSRHNLGCEEPPRRGPMPGDMAGLAEGIREIEKELLPLLDQFVAEEKERPALFGPLGIGGDVDRRAAAGVIFRNRAWLEQRLDLYFYEDLPYASNPMHRAGALGRLKRFADTAERQMFIAPWQEKRVLIGIYKS